MKTFVQIVVVVVMLSGTMKLSAQDMHFSQFYDVPILRNPALTGLFLGDFRGTAAYRSQWQSLGAPYKTIAAGFELKIPVEESENRLVYNSVGLQVTSDKAGDAKLSKTQIMPVWNFHFLFNKETNSMASIAFMGDWTLHHFDRSALTFDDQFVNGTVIGTSAQKFDYTSRSHFNAGVGVLYNYGGYVAGDFRYYIGLGFHNLVPVKRFKYFMDTTDESTRSFKVGVNAGTIIPTGDYTRVSLYGDYFRQSGNELIQLGALLTLDVTQDDLENDQRIGVTGGLVFRPGDALIPVIRLEYNNLQLGFSYDANVRKLTVAGRPKEVFELTLSGKGFLNILDPTLRKVTCFVNRLTLGNH